MYSMDENCTVYKTIDFISKKWSLLILLEIYKSPEGKKRYSDRVKKWDSFKKKWNIAFLIKDKPIFRKKPQ